MERLVYISLCLILISCQKDPYFGPIGIVNDTVSIDSSATKLLIGCEGNFQFGNASLSVLDLNENTVQNDVYRSINDRPIGDVFQSIYRHGDSLYCVINNSGTIRILDPNTLLEIGVVEGLQSPRYVYVKGRQAYVTDLFSKAISMVDLQSLEVTVIDDLGDWTEHIVRFQDRIAVADVNGERVLILNEALELVSTISVDVQPRFMKVLDNTLVVAGNGPGLGSKGRLITIDKNFDIKSFRELESIVSMDALGSDIYTLHDSKIMFHDAVSLEQEFSVELDLQTPYSLAVSPDQSRMFVCDVKDYVSKGSVLEYDLVSKHWVDTHAVGYIPQAMFFTL